MTFEIKIAGCLVDNDSLLEWIKKNKLSEKNFSVEKKKWEREINHEPSFFSDTTFLLVWSDFLLLQVPQNNLVSLLAKTYCLDYQNICHKVFQERKNIILISKEQWKKSNYKEKLIVLLKDETNCKKSLVKWLEKWQITTSSNKHFSS